MADYNQQQHQQQDSLRLACITGVSSGIGKALFVELASRGWMVAGCARRADKMEEMLREVADETSGSVDRERLFVSTVDVRKGDEVAAWADRAAEHFGVAPTLVVANAGIGGGGQKVEGWKLDPDELANVLQTNVIGVLNVARAFVPKMLAREDGVRSAFVAISSGLGRSTAAKRTAYCSSKFAVEAMVKCIAHDLVADGSLVLAVALAPGILRTEMNTQDAAPPANSSWAEVAVSYMLGETMLAREDPGAVNGASLSVPGYYAEAYRSTWIIEDGTRLRTSRYAEAAVKQYR